MIKCILIHFWSLVIRSDSLYITLKGLSTSVLGMNTRSKGLRSTTLETQLWSASSEADVAHSKVNSPLSA